MKLSEYHRKNYRFSYLRTLDDVEIDCVVERPGLPLLCIEIKSKRNVVAQDITAFKKLTQDIPNSEAVVISQDKYAKKIDHVIILSWQQALSELFGAG